MHFPRSAGTLQQGLAKKNCEILDLPLKKKLGVRREKKLAKSKINFHIFDGGNCPRKKNSTWEEYAERFWSDLALGALERSSCKAVIISFDKAAFVVPEKGAEQQSRRETDPAKTVSRKRKIAEAPDFDLHASKDDEMN